MFEHLDDQDGINPGQRELSRVLNRAADIRGQRNRLLTVGTCFVLLVASVAFFVARPGSTPLSASAADYNFNALRGTLNLGLPVPGSALIDMNFVSPMNGFALAAHRSQVVLASTTDGGSHWMIRNNHLPSGLGANNGYPGQIEFVGFTGYLWGAENSRGQEPLWVSHDDGATWRQAPIAANVVDASAIGLNVWALTTTCSSTATVPLGTCAMTVDESQDGGTTWSPVLVQSAQQLPSDAALQVPLELARITRARAYVLSVTSDIGMGLPPTREIAYTDDSGATWSQRSVPCAGDFDQGAELAASATNDLWLLCGSIASGGSQPKDLFRSLDGGENWIPIATATNSLRITSPTVTIPTAPLPLAGYIAPLTIGHRNLAVVSPSTAWLFPSRAPLFKTSDGGAQWDPVTNVGEAGFASGGAGNITFLSSTDGWICEYGIGIWHTSDGAHWASLSS